MMQEDTIRGLKIISTLTLGHFAGASLYQVLTVQPSLIELEDVPSSAKMMRSMISRSLMMPLSVLGSSISSLALYFKTRGTSSEDTFWLISGGTLLLMMPYTAVLIGPINLQFRKEPKPTFTDEDDRWRGLLTDWLTFHIPRALISITLFTAGVCRIVK